MQKIYLLVGKNYLLADIGNSNTKIEVYSDSDLRHYTLPSTSHEGEFPIEVWSEIIKSHRVEVIVYSSVIPRIDKLIEKLAFKGQIFQIGPHIKLPFEIHYKTPHTLGSDRICLVAAAAKDSKNDDHSASLVIGAGTCITFDVLEGRKYIGGAISPGIHMRARAMHHFTYALPLVEINHLIIDDDHPIFLGQSTEECLLAGSLQGAVFEINEYIERLSKKYEKLNIYLTGGDAHTLEKMIKTDIFARPNMCLEGLNILYRLNA